MEVTSLDRISNLRPSGGNGASLGVGQVIPVAPVNPPIQSNRTESLDSAPIPSVINLVNQTRRPNDGEAVYTSVSDPARRGSEAATTPKDWTITRPEPVKEEIPPPPPISKLLIDFLNNMWRASASAVNDALADYPRKVEIDAVSPVNKPGDIAKEVFTYSPASVAKTEKALSGDAGSSATSS